MPAVFTFSEAGGHPDNEDAFGVWTRDDALVCAVADGMGGQPGGGPAARLAVRATEVAGSLGVIGALEKADEAVWADPEAGLTTLIGFQVLDNRVHGASCGDSAVWALDVAGRGTELTAQQTKNPPVGSGDATFVTFEATFTPPWLLIAMTDGVWKYVGWPRLKEATSRLRGQPLIDELQKLARLPGSGRFQDDFTLVVIQDSE